MDAAGRRSRTRLGASAVLVAALLAVSACSSSSTPASSSSGTRPGTVAGGTTAGTVRPAAAPVAVGSPEFEAVMRPALAETVDRLHLPGAFVMIRTPQGTFAESFGTREAVVAAPLEEDDHYRIGSITKTMTATVVLQLVDEGKVRLEDPVSTYVDGVPNGDRVTVRELLNMTSGLPEYTNTEQLEGRVIADPTKPVSPQDALAIAFDPASTRPPGAPTPQQGSYFYDNTNYVLLGLIIEKVTGSTASEQLARRIFEPLGMTSSRLPLPDEHELPDPHGHGYLFGLDAADPARGQDVTDWNAAWAWTAGGAVSTPRDMAVYAEALTDGRLLRGDLQARRLHGDDFVPVGAGDDLGYGLGIVEAQGYYGHSGGLFGFSGWVLHHPERDTTIVLYTTTLAVPGDGNPARTLLETVTTTMDGSVLVPAVRPAANDGVADANPDTSHG